MIKFIIPGVIIFLIVLFLRFFGVKFSTLLSDEKSEYERVVAILIKK